MHHRENDRQDHELTHRPLSGLRELFGQPGDMQGDQAQDLPDGVLRVGEGQEMDEELKPCPFCGGQAMVSEDDGKHRPNIVCVVCNLRVYADTRLLAIKRWNTRAGDGR